MRSYLTLTILPVIFIVFFYFSLDLKGFIEEVIPPDSLSYIEAANMLYLDFKPHPIRPLGYAFLVGLPNVVYSGLSNNDYILFSCCINLVSWVLSLIFLYKSLYLFFSRRISFCVTLVSLSAVGGIFSVFWLLTEPVTVLFLSLFAYNLAKFMSCNSIEYFINSASLLNILMLIRPGFVYLGVGLTFLVVLRIIKSLHAGNIPRGLIGFLSSIALVVVQFIMMHSTYGKATPSFIDKITWYLYLGAESHAAAEDIPLQEVRTSRMKELYGKPFKEQSELCKTDLKTQMMENTQYVFTNWILNISENSTSGSNVLKLIERRTENEKKDRMIAYLLKLSAWQNSFFIILYLAALAILIWNRFNGSYVLLILSIVVAYVILTSGLSFWQGDRFHIILYQLILLLFMFSMKDRLNSWSRFSVFNRTTE
jgi:hypothetical protein